MSSADAGSRPNSWRTTDGVDEMADDVQLECAYLCEEHGDGEALVLLHRGGSGVDARAFGPNLAALVARFSRDLPSADDLPP